MKSKLDINSKEYREHLRFKYLKYLEEKSNPKPIHLFGEEYGDRFERKILADEELELEAERFSDWLSGSNSNK